MPQSILITGGAGYVGSHTVAALMEKQSDVEIVVVDNLHNAYRADGQKKPEPIRIIEEMTGRDIHFYDLDIRDAKTLCRVFEKVSKAACCMLVFRYFTY